jgi:hypothetical protein
MLRRKDILLLLVGAIMMTTIQTKSTSSVLAMIRSKQTVSQTSATTEVLSGKAMASPVL